MALAQELVDLVCSSCVTGPDTHGGEASQRAARHVLQEWNPPHRPSISQSEWTRASTEGVLAPFSHTLCSLWETLRQTIENTEKRAQNPTSVWVPISSLNTRVCMKLRVAKLPHPNLPAPSSQWKATNYKNPVRGILACALPDREMVRQRCLKSHRTEAKVTSVQGGLKLQEML